MLSRFHLISERHGRTDRQTDRIAISKSVQFNSLQSYNKMFSEAVGLLEQVGFKPHQKLTSTYQW